MQRCDLAPVVLQMKALGIVNIVRFDFISVGVIAVTLYWLDTFAFKREEAMA